MTTDTFPVIYNASYSGGDPAVELHVQPASVPKASTVTMLVGAALMGGGYAALRRIHRRKDDDGSAEADEASEKVAS